MRYFEFSMWPEGGGKIGLGEILDALPPNDLHWLMREFDGFFRKDSGFKGYRELRDAVRSDPGHWFTWEELNRFADALGDTDWCTLVATRSRDELMAQLPVAGAAYNRLPIDGYDAKYLAPLCPAVDCWIDGIDSGTWELSMRERFYELAPFHPQKIRMRPAIPGQLRVGPARPLS